MTKEINDIIKAFKAAQQAGRQTALATVVQVDGSSYRSPGARMLVEDNGRITGAISGGCLEGDALRKALQAMSEGKNRLVTYDTLHEDDIEFGVQLGCNGIVHILFEPIDASDAHNPIAMLEQLCSQPMPAVVVTLFSLSRSARQIGTCYYVQGDTVTNKMAGSSMQHLVVQEASQSLATGSGVIKHYEEHDVSAFYEVLQPPVSLVIVGAGNDAQPLVQMSLLLGWQVTVIDGRATHATAARFANVNRVLVSKPAEAVAQLDIDDRTAFVLMTHNYNYDLAMLKHLLQAPCGYIGTLGPKKRMETMLADLQAEGCTITKEARSRIYGPTGLDIGAEAPEEIALSIAAEIKAVMAGHTGGHLRARQTGIHERPEQTIVAPQTILQGK